MTNENNRQRDANPLIQNVASATLRDEQEAVRILNEYLDLTADQWDRIRRQTTELVSEIREASDTPLIDQFLTEFGLSSNEGVQLMRLAEALSRTGDVITADALIADKLAGFDWLSHASKDKPVAIRTVSLLLHLASHWIQWSRKQSQGIGSAVASIGNAVLRFGSRSFIRALSSQFVFASTLDGAMKRARQYGRDGYLFSFDMLGEAARSQADAKKYYHAYQEALDTVIKNVRSDDPSENNGISIKLSALHPRYEYGQAETVVLEIVQLLKPLMVKARSSNVQITIDAEEAERLDISMQLLESLMEMGELKGWSGLGFVVQAYQRRALPLLEWLVEKTIGFGAPLTIRLVKGAYWDSEIKRAQELGLESYPVFTRKESTDLSYLACAKKLLANPQCFSPQFATHNAHSVIAVRELAGADRKLEYQRLFGMGQRLHDLVLKHDNQISRIYAPVGTQKDLLSYLIRRLLENGANSSFVNKLSDPETAIAELVADPPARLKDYPSIANDKIPKPTDYLGNGRITALGRDFSNPVERRRFQSEINTASGAAYSAHSIINGTPIHTSGQQVHNPADVNQSIGEVHNANNAIASQAMDAAKTGFQSWSETSSEQRAATLKKAASLFEDRAATFHYLAIKEAGKTWSDAVDEVREAVDFCRYYAEQAIAPDFKDRYGLGVVVCISPWNFPLAIFLGQITAALAAGNTVVAKPADQTPLVATEAVKLLHEAGVPIEALQLATGNGRDVGAALVSNDNVDGVCFTGSTATAKNIARSLAQSAKPLTPLIAETGGINAMIVDSSALPEQTIDAIISSAFQSAGQRCSALRLLCLQDDIADQFIELLAGAMSALKLGDPADLQTDVGPVIDKDAKKNIDDYVAAVNTTAKNLGPKNQGCPEGGHFVSPVAFEIENVSELKREIFGPVLHIVRYSAAEKSKLIEQINSSGYGLTFGIQSRVDDLTEQYANQINAGNVYVNRNQIGAVVGTQPFGGEGLSGTGPKAGGPLYLYRLSKPRQETISTGQAKQVPEGNVFVESSSTDEFWHDILNTGISASTVLSNMEPMARFGLLRKLDGFEEFRDKIEREFEQLMSLAPEDGELPSTAGETNHYTLQGRGLLISLLSDEGEVTRSVSRAFVTGNSLIHICSDGPNHQVQNIADDLHELTGIPDLVQFAAISKIDQIFNDMTVDSIGGIIVNNHDCRIEKIANMIADWKGPIVPVLTPDDWVGRYVQEKVITNNIAATGGDVSLLNT